MWSVLAVLSLAVVVLGAVGVVSCLVGQQRPAGMGGEPPHSTLPMLALHSGMERLRLEAGVGAGRPERQSSHTRRAVDCAVDRAVRLAAVSTDLQLDLPPNIALPDGEEYPYGASARLHIRDPDQESEIYQKCIRPPPNRTVFDGESPPPYRSSSASGSFAGGGSSGSAILRCPVAVHPGAHPGAHPGSALVSAAPAGPGLPAVIVPSPPRKQDAAVSPALFLAGPATSGKHSTGPPSGGVGSGSTAAGLARLLSPSLTPAPTPDRVLTVRPTAAGAKTSAQGQASVPVLVCRTAHSAPSGRSGRPSAAGVDLVNVTSAPCSPAVRVIPATVRGASHLAGLTMVPCLTESRTEAASSATAEPSPSPCAPAPARTRERPEEEPLATPLPRPARPPV